MRRFFLLAVKETIYYWKKAGKISTRLISDLTLGINTMLHYMGYLLYKIYDDHIEYIPYNIKYSTDDERDNSTLFFSVFATDCCLAAVFNYINSNVHVDPDIFLFRLTGTA